jgi:hypothetical protein
LAAGFAALLSTAALDALGVRTLLLADMAPSSQDAG